MLSRCCDFVFVTFPVNIRDIWDATLAKYLTFSLLLSYESAVYYCTNMGCRQMYKWFVICRLLFDMCIFEIIICIFTIFTAARMQWTIEQNLQTFRRLVYSQCQARRALKIIRITFLNLISIYLRAYCIHKHNIAWIYTHF